MDTTYSLNPNPLPVDPSVPENHHRSFITGGIAMAIVLIVGGLYWWSVSNRQPEVVKQQEDYRQTIIDTLNRVPESQASSEEIDRIVTRLSAPPATTPSAEEKSAIIDKLNSYREPAQPLKN